jgi:hypothetical protein
MSKQEQKSIYFSAIEECKNKTVSQMKTLFNSNTIHDTAITNMINQRTAELNYNDGTGALYI